MENTNSLEQRRLINELTEGRDFAKQLQNTSLPPELRELLQQKIISSFTKSLSMLKCGESEVDPQPIGPIKGTDSPRSLSGSPRSDNSERIVKDQERGYMSKKRKMLPKWSEQVRISTGTGLEGPLEDGYSWRKYGQKDILGAKYPRGYYRCTHRNVQGCLATKQVQRSDEDPIVFDVTYRGHHTCFQASQLILTPPLPEKQEQQQHHHHHQQQKEIILNFRTGLKVKTEDLNSPKVNSSTFSFPSASVDCPKTEDHIFSTLDNHFMGSFSPPFISPATSESNYFSVSPCRMNSFGGQPNLRTSESDLTEIISAATSASNSPMPELDFPLDPAEFDIHFPFDNPGFFSQL
ncbi:putative WRKY transcription factor 41 [Tasmannia lanceolata]|uniref:putative WRKY transcription factor 41 n=1 Tax=Tasmannia lanceolata TaxID=3420 RepID=UPI0040649E71